MDIKQLLTLNIEVEGLLRVLDAHPSDEARELLDVKFDQLAKAIAEWQKPVENLETSFPKPEPIVVEPEPIVEAMPEAEPVVMGESVVMPEPETVVMPEPVYEPVKEPVEVKIVAETPITNEKLMAAFTLNDRFRFSRELFDGNMDDFRDTIGILAAMPNLAEAKDFLYNDLMLDKANPEVEAFVAIITEAIPS